MVGTDLGSVKFVIHSMFWSLSVNRSPVKMELSCGVGARQTASTHVIHKGWEWNFKGVATVLRGEIEWYGVIVPECESA